MSYPQFISDYWALDRISIVEALLCQSQQENQRLQYEKGKLQSQNNLLQSENNQLKCQNNDLEHANGQLTYQRNDLEQQLNCLRKEHNELVAVRREEKQKSNEAIADSFVLLLATSNSKLIKELDKAKQDIAQLSKENNFLSQQVKQLEEQIKINSMSRPHTKNHPTQYSPQTPLSPSSALSISTSSTSASSVSHTTPAPSIRTPANRSTKHHQRSYSSSSSRTDFFKQRSESEHSISPVSKLSKPSHSPVNNSSSLTYCSKK